MFPYSGQRFENLSRHELVEEARRLSSDLQNTLRANSDALEELKCVKSENRHLNYANNVLSWKLGSYFPSDLARFLPPEILLRVFRNALAPRWMLSGTNTQLAHPTDIPLTDLRMKLCLLNVCKAWHHVAVELLYESVHLRRIGQLPAFVHALEGRQGLGFLVRHLDIRCFVPRGYSALFESETKCLFQLCPRLSHLGLLPTFSIPSLPLSLAHTTSSITSLEYDSGLDFSIVYPSLVHLCGSLRCLALGLPNPRNTDSLAPLVFPELEDLRFHLPHASISDDLLTLKWTMNSLRRLWLTTSSSRLSNRPSDAQIEALLDTHGRNLTLLSLNFDTPNLQQLLNRCPILEHLVIYYQKGGKWNHKTVKHLDVWHRWAQHGRKLTLPRKDRFPALLTFRNLDLTFGHLWDLPVRIPPRIGEDSVIYQEADPQGVVPGSRDIGPSWRAEILEFTARETPNYNTVLFGPELTVEANSDDEKEDEADGSDSDSCSTVSEDGGYLEDEFYLEEDWEADRDQALEIFAGMQ
ncbi:hypothetical protein B0H11DRAFT_117939 [Mycena galericulata]|nr:hypothetical protein B0H11DRAFT_117939 [Mycena galericulata]